MNGNSKARPWRKSALAVLLCIAVAPGLWWRPPNVAGERTGRLWVEPLDVTESSAEGPVQVGGAWILRSDDRRFYGYSALLFTPQGRLRAYSDGNRRLDFDPPDRPAVRVPKFQAVPGYDERGHNDLESAAWDPSRGFTWLGFENLNSLRRIGPGPKDARSVRPAAMADFRANGGAETLVRLPDGRFVVIAESAQWRDPLRRAGLMFARDPVADPRSAPFFFNPPVGTSPVDGAALPDGRALLLVRGFSATRWPPFRSKLLIADSADLERGQTWKWRELADLSAAIPPENYEGLAVEKRGDRFVLWLISDANGSVLQRTILVKLMWDGRTPDEAFATGR